MRATHIPVIPQQTYPRNGPSRYQEWFSKQQLRNKSLEITSLPAGMREFVCSDVATITGISEIRVEDDFWKDPIFYIETKTELATENETRIHKDDEEELLAFQKDIYNAVLGSVIEEKENLLDWDAYIEIPPPPRQSSTVKVRFKYIGRSKPIPIEDPWT